MNALATTNNIYSLIDRAPLAQTTKAQYQKALRNYLATGNSLTDSQALSDYAADLPKSSKSFLKAAIRLWGDSIILDSKSRATPENIGAVQATVYRIEALNNAIQVPATKGEKAHTWLTQTEVKRLLSFCDDSLTGRRDRAILSVLLGAGLRCNELSNLTFDALMQQGDRTILQVRGKGSKDRIIPISIRLAQILEDWHKITGDGYIARSLGMNRELGERLSDVQIYRIVAQYGGKIGKELAPHDLRRSYAQLGYEAGVPITQISKLLGHSNVATTQRYLNLDLDLAVTASDFIPL